MFKKIIKEIKRNVDRNVGMAEKIAQKGGLGTVAKKLMAKKRGSASPKGKMTMGELDKLRAETGQTAAIPREAMAEGVASAAEKYNKA